MDIIEIARKNKVGAIIAALYFLAAYKLLDAQKSVTSDILGLGIEKYAFWIDFAVAVLIGMLLQYLIERYIK